MSLTSYQAAPPRDHLGTTSLPKWQASCKLIFHIFALPEFYSGKLEENQVS